MKQKFKKYDHVMIAKYLGKCASHFPSDHEAIVMYSYKDKYGGDTDGKHEYCVYIKGMGEVSWYESDQLTLIRNNGKDILKTWKAEAKTKHDQESDLDWIFENGPDIIDDMTGSSIEALAKCLGLTSNDLWGGYGEGFVYSQNAGRVFNVAKPYLLTKDKEGWLKYCEQRRKSQ